MKALSLAVVLGALVSQTGWAQPTRSLPPEKMLQIGDESFGKADTYTALEWYTKAYDADPSNVYAIAQIAQTHDKLRDYKEASTWYGRLVKEDKNKQYPLARFKYAYVLKLSGQYEDAIKEFLAFQKEYNQPDADRFKKLAELEIEGARWARKNPEPFEPLVIENMGRGINTPSSEDGAFAAGRDKIYFSSLRTDTLIYTQEAAEDKKIAKIYVSNRAADGKAWDDAKEFNNDVLFKAGFHAVQPSFTPDKSKFYFAQAQLEGNMLKNSRIYVCTNADGKLGQPTPLSFNAPSYACKNPQVGVIDGKLYLFFSSNKEGGKGGFDIWYAEINADGSTREPLNVGDAVNTLGDEITPFYDSRENILYFSSNGLPTVGGFDVFRSKNTAGTFAKPENMGFGFNSRVDDFGFMINQEGNDDCYAYVVSNRPGTISMKSETCCDDIFSILMPDRCDIVANVDVLDEDKKQPLKGATVQLIDKATGKVIDEQTNAAGNNYTFILSSNKQYDIVAKKDGYDKPAAQTKISTKKEELGEITKPVTITKQTFLKELGLVAETYNAKTQQPLTGVTVTVLDAATGAELKKETYNDKNRYMFVLGRDKEYKIIAKRDGFKNEERTLTLQQVKAGDLQKLYLTPFELPIFYDIHFDFDKSDLRQGAVDTLQIVLQTLQQYSNLVVEVRGHTDSKGADDYNDKLSAKRSQHAIEWLEGKGIARERLIPRAMGEKEPVAANDKDGQDNPEGRQLNRRVEFKIIDAKDAQGATKPTTPATNVTESGAPVKTSPKAEKMSGEKNTAKKAEKMSGKTDKATEEKTEKIEKKK